MFWSQLTIGFGVKVLVGYWRNSKFLGYDKSTLEGFDEIFYKYISCRSTCRHVIIDGKIVGY